MLTATGSKKRERERRSESDDEVRQNISPDQHSLFNRVRRQIQDTPNMSRTEVFQQYLAENPGDLIDSLERDTSEKLKKHLRSELDFYETPAWCIQAILPRLPRIAEPIRVLDPGCGTGAIMREVRAMYPRLSISGVELDAPRAAEARKLGIEVVQRDFLTYEPEQRPDLIISNPPYSHALEFVMHAMTIAPVVCMLLRLPWIASQSRAKWHRENPAHVHILPRRPSFMGTGKTDATEYAWFVWGAPPVHNVGVYSILDVERVKRRR